MEFSVVLKQNKDFRRLYRRGRSAVTPTLAIYCRGNGTQTNRLGITTGVKVGKAVVRNKIRRRLRAIYRLHESQLKCGYDVVVVARVRASHATYAQLEHDFLQLTRRIKLSREEDA